MKLSCECPAALERCISLDDNKEFRFLKGNKMFHAVRLWFQLHMSTYFRLVHALRR